MIGIYCLRNIEDGKVYIGSSINIERRKRGHLSYLRSNNHSNAHLQLAFNSYGINSFEFSILENVDVTELIAREQYWIDYFNSSNREFGYNICPRADHHTVSNETKRKISLSSMGKIMSEESNKKHSITNKLLGIKLPSRKGVKVSDVTKLKCSNSRKLFLKNNPAFKVYSHKGLQRTEATKLKMSIAAKNRKKNVL